MDATASGAQWQPQGEMNLVSGMRRVNGRRCKPFRWNWPGRTRTGKESGRMGADGEMVWSRRPQAGVKSCGDVSSSTGLECIIYPHGDGGNSAWLTEEITYKA
ncbi:MAG: hypothetical protein V4517_11090 [Pseudomonadota bacterium]